LFQKDIDLQHVVVGNFRSSKPYSYFMDSNHPEKPNEYVRSRELIRELYAKMGGITQFDFSTLTLHNTWTPNYVVNAFMMLFAADADSGRAGYARGLWPVSGWQSGTVKKTEFAHYQESAIIQSRKDFQMGTIIHETGHQVMGLGEDQGDWGNANWDRWCTINCFRY
jgi:M6 family metalloprotease-like protein